MRASKGTDGAARRRALLVVGILLLGLRFLVACHDTPRRVGGPTASDIVPLVFTPREEIREPFGRIGDVAVAADGRIFVADAIERSIWCFDSSGHLLGHLGRRGKGPGEFSYVTSLAISRDRLFVLDAALQRITVFPLDGWRHGVPAGLEAETFPAISASRSATGQIAATPDGDLLVQLALPIVNYDTVSSADRLIRVFSPRGVILQDSMMAVPNDEWLVTRGGGGYSVSPMPFGRRSILRVGPNGAIYHLWTGDTYVSVLARGRNESRKLEIPGLSRRPVTPSDVAAMRTSIVTGESPGMKALLGRRFDKATESHAIPDSMPTLSDFLVDDQDNLWLTPVTDSDEEVSTSLGMLFQPRDGLTKVLTFNSRTGAVGQGSVPLNGRLEAVAANRLYFVTWDSLDVESLRVFELARN